MYKNILFSVLSKLGLAIYSILLLKILSIYLLPISFSKYYLNYNLSLYLYTFLFTIQSNVLLRYYHSVSKFILSKFLYKINILITGLLIMLYLGLVFIANFDFLDSLFLLVFCTTFGYYNFKITLFRIKGLFKNIFIVQIAQIFLCICLLLFNRNTLNPNLIFCINTATNILPFFIFKKSFKFKILKFKEYSFNENEIKFFKYGLPIVLISFITFALSSSDQFFLKYFNYNRELSGYIANYSIAEKGVLIILSVMSFVFQPFFFKKHQKLTAAALKDVIKVASLFLVLSFFIFIIVFNFSSELTVLLSSKNYIEYSWLIPIVVVGGVFIGLNSLFSELLTLTFKTSLLMLSYLIGFVTNVILNYLFIPQYGITAAVWSSVFAYFIMFITTIIFVVYQFKTNKYVSV